MSEYLQENVELVQETPEENMAACDHCGQEHPAEALTTVGGLELCEECLDEQTFVCERCGSREPIDESVYVDEDVLCESCADDYTSICDHCHERAYDHDVIHVDGDTVCQHCLDHNVYVSECAECGETHYEDNMEYDDDEDAYFCPDCGSSRDIRSYHSGTRLRFYGEGKYHLGVELEVDSKDYHDRKRSARNVIDTMDDHVYCENDSSLAHGFEIITHPHTYEELISLPWKEALSGLVRDGWRGHDVDTAGLHVHIGRGCFDTEEAITRFCTFFENNWAFVKAFSRRTDSQLQSYAARYFDDDDGGTRFTAGEVKAKTEESRNRYRAVNLTGYSTIEVRVFRSTLKYSTFMASLELVYLLAERSNSITDEEAEAMTVSEWLRGASETLQAYCASRGYALDMTANTEREAA